MFVFIQYSDRKFSATAFALCIAVALPPPCHALWCCSVVLHQGVLRCNARLIFTHHMSLIVRLWVQIRKTLFDMQTTATGYTGVDVLAAVDAISSLRGNVSAMADSADNYADEGLYTVSFCSDLVMS